MFSPLVATIRSPYRCSERRSLARLNDSKQHTEAGREQLYPLVIRAAAKTAIVVRCVRGIDARGLHKTNLAALRAALRAERDMRSSAPARWTAVATAAGAPPPPAG